MNETSVPSFVPTIQLTGDDRFRYFGRVVGEVIGIYIAVQLIIFLVYYFSPFSRGWQRFQIRSIYLTSFSKSFTASMLLLLFRIGSFLYFVGNNVVYNFVNGVSKNYIFLIYFTNWNVLLICVYFLFVSIASLTVLINDYQPISTFQGDSIIYLKSFCYFVNIILEVTGGTAFLVTVLDFIYLNPSFHYWNASLHFANSMFLLAELILSRLVVRLDHFSFLINWPMLYLGNISYYYLLFSKCLLI
jgi:hypothetical protein